MKRLTIFAAFCIFFLAGSLYAADYVIYDNATENEFYNALESTTIQIVDFDTFPDGNPVPTGYDPGGNWSGFEFKGDEWADWGIYFSTPNGQPMTTVNETKSGRTYENFKSYPNSLTPGQPPFVGYEVPAEGGNEDPLEIVFNPPRPAVGLYFIDNMPTAPEETVEFLDVDNNIITAIPSPCCAYVSFLGIISDSLIAKIRIHEVKNDSDDVAYDDIVSGIPIDKWNKVKAFVARFYDKCLSRKPDDEGLNQWVSDLFARASAGADVAYGFVFSNEYQEKNTSDDEYLRMLYEAFFNRQPDSAGFENWKKAISEGLSREEVLNGFIYAPEFIKLCENYGIIPALDPSSPPPKQPNPPTDREKFANDFITRFYRLCLNRNPDPEGLNNWVKTILSGSNTGADLAHGFIYSNEFINFGTSNAAYLEVLYEAFFNRKPDSGGFKTWLAELENGKPRWHVLYGFIFSEEFKELCEQFGIKPYDVEQVLPPPPPRFTTDDDGDGYSEETGDCDDANFDVKPEGTEICGDGIDQDCSGGDLKCQDAMDDDNDGFAENQGDCDDANANIYPGAQEVCGDGIDQDCNGEDLKCSAAIISIEVTPPDPSLNVGDKQQFTATANYDDGTTRDITKTAFWHTSNGSVAVLDESLTPGLFKAVGAGETTITASKNSVSGKAKLIVSEKLLQLWLGTDTDNYALQKTAPSFDSGMSMQLYIYSSPKVYEIPINGDISGNIYQFAFYLAVASYSDVFYAEIVLNPGAAEQILASTSFTVSGSTYKLYEKSNVVGVDPDSKSGDILALRIKANYDVGLLFANSLMPFIRVPAIE